MRISNATIESYTSTDRATKKTVKLHRVRWRSYATDGAPGRQCKESGFKTKGRAEAFIADCLDTARFGHDGWSFDHRGYPQRTTAEPDAERGDTTLDLVRTYVKTVWFEKWKPHDGRRYLEVRRSGNCRMGRRSTRCGSGARPSPATCCQLEPCSTVGGSTGCSATVSSSTARQSATLTCAVSNRAGGWGRARNPFTTAAHRWLFVAPFVACAATTSARRVAARTR